MRHQISSDTINKGARFGEWTQFFWLWEETLWAYLETCLGFLQEMCPDKVLPVLGYVSASLQGQRHEDSKGNKERRRWGTELWETREKGTIRKEKRIKEGNESKYRKVLKKGQGNHPHTTEHSFPSLFCSEVLVSRFCITSDCPETQPREKQCSCLGQWPGCCLPKNVFIELEVTILCFWKCNIWYKPSMLTYSFWKRRSHLSFRSSFWLKSF